ncbi:Ankyrin repeat domain containing protein [Pandoravirus macleodensis]|uniref:Ankyrin repeat domain containing protein n=1 Tax=Pandoravirus macleodensis TaxID=2107707 RepID=A0A2U7UFP1_9VIRU|nr:Ankyrin repeat domain containing protein [Pandoravirus macleodensis]AVK77130.1 Ankyrin repeat domain containing protein [Pandoravirus macleodensis]
MTTAAPVGIADLPNEIICCIADLLDDASFCAARAAHGIFRVHSRDEIHSKRRVPRWLAGNPRRYIRRGHVEAVEAWKASGYRFTTWDLFCAVEEGHAMIVTMLYEDCIAGCMNEGVDLFATAASEGHLNIVRLLHERDCPGCTPNAIDYAASWGHVAIVKYLHNNRTEGCTKDALRDAAMSGHLDVVEFLCSNRSEGRIADALMESVLHNRDCAQVTAHLAHEYIVRDLHSTDQRLDPCDLAQTLPSVAATLGYTATVDALAQLIVQEEDAQYWFETGAKAAAKAGLVDTVRVLVPRCSRWQTKGILIAAAEHGHANVVRAMLGNDHPIREPAALTAAAHKGHTEVVRLLLSLDCTRGWLQDAECADALGSAAIGGHLDTLVFLCEHMHLIGADIREPTAHARAVRGAAMRKHVDCVRFLVDTAGGDALVARAMEDCVTSGQTDALRLLFDLYGTDLFAECATESVHEPSDYLPRLRALCLRPKIVAIDLDVRNCRCASTCRFALLGKAASSRSKAMFDLLCKTWLRP